MDVRSWPADVASAPSDEQLYWDEGLPLLKKLLYESRSSAPTIKLAVQTVNRRRPAGMPASERDPRSVVHVLR